VSRCVRHSVQDRARLPSFVPSGVIRFCSSSPTRSAGALLIRQYSKTPSLHHSVRKDSRTARPTKPKLYSADRSSRPRKRGALHNQDVGEVGRTTTRTITKHLSPNREDQGRIVPVPLVTEAECQRFRRARFVELAQVRLVKLFEQVDWRCVAAEESQSPFFRR
jgi:hypothetical protein